MRSPPSAVPVAVLLRSLLFSSVTRVGPASLLCHSYRSFGAQPETWGLGYPLGLLPPGIQPATAVLVTEAACALPSAHPEEESRGGAGTRWLLLHEAETFLSVRLLVFTVCLGAH